MGVYRSPAVFSIACDKCGEGFDTMGEARTISDQVQQLIESGWKGNRKKIFCPECVALHPQGRSRQRGSVNKGAGEDVKCKVKSE